jgi:hypothetical protein
MRFKHREVIIGGLWPSNDNESVECDKILKETRTQISSYGRTAGNIICGVA